MFDRYLSLYFKLQKLAYTGKTLSLSSYDQFYGILVLIGLSIYELTYLGFIISGSFDSDQRRIKEALMSISNLSNLLGLLLAIEDYREDAATGPKIFKILPNFPRMRILDLFLTKTDIDTDHYKSLLASFSALEDLREIRIEYKISKITDTALISLRLCLTKFHQKKSL